MILVYSRMKQIPAKTGQRVRLKSLNRWERMRKAGHNNLAHFFRVLKRPQHVPSIFYGCHWSRLKTCERHEKSDPQSTALRSKVRLWPSNWSGSPIDRDGQHLDPWGPQSYATSNGLTANFEPRMYQMFSNLKQKNNCSISFSDAIKSLIVFDCKDQMEAKPTRYEGDELLSQWGTYQRKILGQCIVKNKTCPLGVPTRKTSTFWQTCPLPSLKASLNDGTSHHSSLFVNRVPPEMIYHLSLFPRRNCDHGAPCWLYLPPCPNYTPINPHWTPLDQHKITFLMVKSC